MIVQIIDWIRGSMVDRFSWGRIGRWRGIIQCIVIIVIRVEKFVAIDLVIVVDIIVGLLQLQQEGWRRGSHVQIIECPTHGTHHRGWWKRRDHRLIRLIVFHSLVIDFVVTRIFLIVVVIDVVMILTMRIDAGLIFSHESIDFWHGHGRWSQQGWDSIDDPRKQSIVN